MTFKYSFKTASIGLRMHKMRSLLTILGIVIGITSIILVMSIGKGAENLILNQIKGLGAKTIFIEPGREPKGPSDMAEAYTDSLRPKDLEALKRPSNVQGVVDVAPLIFQRATVSFEGETARTNIIGSSELLPRILDLYPDQGSFFTDDDVRQRLSVAVVGSEVKKKLFGESDALNKRIKIKDRVFRVVGVQLAKGQVSFFDADDMVLIPYTTGQQYLFGINYFQDIIVEVESEEIVPRAVKEIELTLRETHGIDNPEKDDFHVLTQADIVERVSVITGVMTALLVSVAAISLVVGGIGIMNIMLVSVTERTREIGLRKALGATKKDILVQFLLEAVILTCIGGAFGIFFGAALAFGASFILSSFVAAGWTFAFPVSAALIGLGVSAGVGLLFGLYPARQASRKDPIEALRYE